MSSTIDNTLAKLGLSGGAIRVYAKLLEYKEASAKRLAELANLPRTSVYDYLSELSKMGLVVELDINNKKVFRPDDPRNIHALLEKRAGELGQEARQFKKLLPQMQKNLGQSEPRVKFYPGQEGFVAVLADVLRSGSKEILFLWPFGEMTDLIGERQLNDFTYRRAQEKIRVRSVHVSSSSKIKFPLEKTRIAPKNVHWDMGAIIYGDKVAFISSRREQFAFVVQSRDFASLQRAQFETLWKYSKSSH